MCVCVCVCVYTIRHTLTDTKTSESLDKLPARKSIGHSRLFGGARRAQGRIEMRDAVREAGTQGVNQVRVTEREREALKTGYIPDWFRYCSR